MIIVEIVDKLIYRKKMRLIDIKRSVNIAFQNFEINNDSSNGNYYMHNIQKLKIALTELSKIHYIDVDEKEVYRLIMSSATDTLILNGNQYSTHAEVLAKLQQSVYLLNNWINQYVPTEETETTINIKLPHISSLNDLAVTSSMLKKSFSQVVPEVGGKVEVKQLDHGSYWVIIDVDTLEAVALIASITWAAVKAAKTIVELGLSYEQYKSYKLSSEALEEMKKKNEEIKQDEIRKSAEEINKTHFNNPDNERCGRISVSIYELCKLIRAGGEIHPSLIAAENKAEEFPDFKKLMFTKKHVAELTNSSDYNGDTGQNDENANGE